MAVAVTFPNHKKCIGVWLESISGPKILIDRLIVNYETIRDMKTLSEIVSVIVVSAMIVADGPLPMEIRMILSDDTVSSTPVYQVDIDIIKSASSNYIALAKNTTALVKNPGIEFVQILPSNTQISLPINLNVPDDETGKPMMLITASFAC